MTDSQSPYRKKLDGRKKITNTVDSNTVSTNKTTVQQKYSNEGLLIETIDRGNKKRRTIDDQDFFSYMFGGSATIVSQDSYTYSDGQFHHD